MSRAPVKVPTFSIVDPNVVVRQEPELNTQELSQCEINQRVAAGDRDLLDYIFDPTPVGGPQRPETKVTDEELGPEGPAIAPELLEQLQSLQLKGIKAAEEKDYTTALAHFTSSIELCPHYASAYNNRAQTRLLMRDEDGALADVNSAIEHAHRDRITLKQAYTQRAIIYKQKNRLDEAQADFAFAGRLGSSLAKSEAIAMNPYAAMCNKVLSQAFEALTKPQVDIDFQRSQQQ